MPQSVACEPLAHKLRLLRDPRRKPLDGVGEQAVLVLLQFRVAGEDGVRLVTSGGDELDVVQVREP